MPTNILPKITILTNTDGSNPKLLEESLYSSLNQTYDNYEILLCSTFNKGITFTKSYNKIRLIETSKFENFPKQLEFAINQIRTPYFCVVDSDDIININHLSTLVEGLNIAKKRNAQSPLAVNYATTWMLKENKKLPYFRSWVSHLFETPDDNMTRAIYEQWCNSKWAKAGQQNGYDYTFRKSKYWNIYTGPKSVKPTYLYRVGVSNHVSKHKYRKISQLSTTSIALKPRFYSNYYTYFK